MSTPYGRTISGADGRIVVRGRATGDALVLRAPLSLLCIRPEDGVIDDVHHPDRGQSVTGRVLCLPATRGGPASTGVLLECLRRGTAPAAMLLGEDEPAVMISCLVGRELYDTSMPVVVLKRESFAALATGTRIEIVES